MELVATGTELSRMSSHMDSAELQFGQRFCAWVVNRRIKLSFLAFSLLVGINLLVLQTHPFDPLDIKNPIVAASLISLATGILVRSWAAGTLHKSQELTTVGPYAVVRNPLYLGSFLMMLGFCMVMRDTFAILFIVGPIAILYWLQIRAEEANLSQWFPNDWKYYMCSTPRILPRLSALTVNAQKLGTGWSLRQWTKNREYNALVASLLGVITLWFLAQIHR